MADPNILDREPQAEEARMGKWFSPTSLASFNRGFGQFLDQNPNVGPQMERLISDYPTLSPEMVASLAYSGQLPADSPLLEDLIQKDKAAQQAAASNPLYSKFKTVIREGTVIAEDLYNAAPYMHLPRIGINMHQGKSFDEAYRASSVSAKGTQTRLNRLGFDTDYGQGLLPSEELVPQGADFWLKIKESILNGEFEGSAEEQIIAAKQQQMVRQGLETGINPYAMARQQWESTVLHKMVNGEEVFVPYSPGAAVAINFTTPGTAAYSNFSGMVDISFRMLAEPVDLVFDNVGDIIRLTNPSVTGDFKSFINKGSGGMQESLKEVFNINILDDPVIVTIKSQDKYGNEILKERAIKGQTIPTEAGPEISVDPKTISRSWDNKQLEARYNPDTDVWLDPTDPYVSFFVENNISPNQLIDAIGSRGGREASFLLTMEHELVHARQQTKWFDAVPIGEGRVGILTESVKKGAPRELKDLAQRVVDDGVTMQDINRVQDAMPQLDESLKRLAARQKEVANDLAKSKKGPARKSLQEDAQKLEDAAEDLRTTRKGLDTELDDMLDRRSVLDEERRAFTERNAVEESYERMMSGKWEAAKAYKTFRMRSGLSKIARPFVNTKSVSEWLQKAGGQRTIKYLLRNNDIDAIRKHLPFLSGEDVLKIHEAKTTGVIAETLQDAFNGYVAGAKRPQIGVFKDTLGKGMDGWQANHTFLGGQIAYAAKMQGRRMGAGTAAAVFTTTDQKGSLDVASNLLRTAKIDPKDINRVQQLIILKGHTTEGIDAVEDLVEELITAKLAENSLYDVEDVQKMYQDWRGFEKQNRHYFVSNAGKDRKWLYRDGRFVPASASDKNALNPEAFMEAQFSQTSRVHPDVRRLRRLTSKQRTTYEKARRWSANFKARNKVPNNVEMWTPLGFESTLTMKVGDIGFGVWRDVNLMRLGWSLRVLPEEQLRFAASGFASIFSNPVDYLISAFNPLDFTLKGDEITLGQLLRQQEALGAGQLRNTYLPPHRVNSSNWSVVREVDSPREYWGGMTRQFITTSADPVVGRVARMGREDALAYFATKEGKAELKRISSKAAKGSSLELIPNERFIQSYMDMAELHIAHQTGGKAAWFDPDLEQWVDLDDNIIPLVNSQNFPNKGSLREQITLLGREDLLVGKSKALRAELEAILHDARGFDINAADKAGRAGIVTTEGNEDLRKLMGERKLDDIDMTDDMPIEQIRAIDEKLKEAYESRGVTPPAWVPVSAEELHPQAFGTAYSKKVDSFFHLFNAAPSRMLNRQPYFAQQFGNKIAQVYLYGDSEMRAAIDSMRKSNKSFSIAMDVGQRKLFKDLAISKYPGAFDSKKSTPNEIAMEKSLEAGVNDVPTPIEALGDSRDAGDYNSIPIEGGGFTTNQYSIWMNEQGNLPVGVRQNRGMFAYRHGTRYGSEGTIRGTDNVVYHGSQTLRPEKLVHDQNRILGLTNERAGLEARISELDELDPDLPALQQSLDEVNQQFDITEGVLTRGETPPEPIPRNLSSGGAAHSIDRASQYSGYMRGEYATNEEWVSAFYVPHLPKHVQDHINEVGDIEQVYQISQHYPELNNIPDLPNNFPKMRTHVNESRDKLVDKMAAARDEMTSDLADLGVVEVRPNVWESVDGTTDAAEAMREVAPDWINDLFPRDYGIGNFMGGGYKPTTLDVLEVEGVAWMENKIGRSLSTEEVTSLREAWIVRTDVDELILIDDAIEPMLQAPLETVRNMINKTGYVATTPRAIGDAALFLERNTEMAASTVARAPTNVPTNSTRMSLNLLHDGAHMTDEVFYDSFNITEGAHAQLEYMDETFENLMEERWHQSTIAGIDKYGIMNFEGSGIEFSHDFATWILSPEFRTYVDEVDIWAADLAQELSQYGGMDQIPSGLKTQLKRFYEADDLATEGHVAYSGFYRDPHIGDDYQPWQNFVEYTDEVAVDGEHFVEMLVESMRARPIRGRIYEEFATATYPERFLDATVDQDRLIPGGRQLKPENEIQLDFSPVKQADRNAAVQGQFGPTYGHDFMWTETGGPGVIGSSPDTTRQLEDLLQAAKYDSIEETKALFYDLAGKSNVADALKFVFPFGDAWYEVLTRWMKLMNPVQSGGQPMRNVRRATTTVQGMRSAGYLTTNEYGEEAFNMPISPGLLANSFIPDGANAHLTSSLPVASMMFIDPTARSIMLPGIGPGIQTTAQIAAPLIEEIPLFSEVWDWAVYGGKDEYRPGDPEGIGDVVESWMPTTLRRIVNMAFDPKARETMGNTKVEIMETLMASGDPRYDGLSPAGAQAAWDVANQTGTWLGWLRVLDAWILPGQPTYSMAFDEKDPAEVDAFWADLSEQSAVDQAPTISILRMRNEFRMAREMFGSAEANLYMIERYGILPSVLQSGSAGLVERPATWGGVKWMGEESWALEEAPLTMAWMVPEDVDDTFDSRNWANQYHTPIEISGLPGQPIRRRRSPQEIADYIQRSAGYDQLRYQTALYDKAVGNLRVKFGEKYASNEQYRAKKRALDTLLRDNKEKIYTEFQIVRGSNQGKIVGETQGVSNRMLMDETIKIGTAGTSANNALKDYNPEMAKVAEWFAGEFEELERISLQQDKGKASGEWWINAESDAGQNVRQVVVDRIHTMMNSLTDKEARGYARRINDRLMSGLLDGWEWIDRRFTPEIETYPTIHATTTLPARGE